MKNGVTTTENNRLHYMDNLKWLLIVLVVLTHFLYERVDTATTIFVDIVYFFHMPAFAFISGLFSKSEKTQSAKSLIELLIIFVLTNSFFVIIMGIMAGELNLVTPYYMTWYILALVIWRLGAKHLGQIRGIIPITIILALISGYFPDVTNTLAIGRIIGFLPYFMIGYKLDREHLDRFRKCKILDKIFISIISLVTISLLSTLVITNLDYTRESLIMGAYSTHYDMLLRLVLMVIASLTITLLILLSPNVDIPVITKCGRNSLTIYIFHRIITLAYNGLLLDASPIIVGLVALLLTLGVVTLFGLDTVHNGFKEFIEVSYNTIFNVKTDSKLSTKIISIAVSVVLLGLVVITPFISSTKFGLYDTREYILYNRITTEKKEAFDNAFTITFGGDLILLEDAVKRGYNGTTYDYSDMFDYTRDILTSADLSIGVFEGPMAGEEAGYSISNYDDGKEMHLNFPDIFATNVLDAGFDIVTTANNHLLDKGSEGMERTIDVLNSVGLKRIGSYKDATDKSNNNVLTIEKDGIKFAILSYTYGINGYELPSLLNDYPYITSYIASPGTYEYDYTKAQVIADLQKAKALNPDFIIVLPHWGEQFTTTPNYMQTTWEKIFIENGADIILGDHTHSVQPTLIKNHNGKNVYISYCPGNYTNVYQEYDGDASILSHIYIDKTTKTIIGGAITPMWGFAKGTGNYTVAPIYDILHSDSLLSNMSMHDIARVKEVHSLITRVHFGEELHLDLLDGDHYYFDSTGYLSKPSPMLEVVDDIKNGVFYTELKKHSKVCFIGDSITAGSMNGGYGWYEPLLSYTDAEVYRIAHGGATTKSIMQDISKVQSNTTLFVIALGTNDIRYRERSMCAMNENEYIENITTLVSHIKGINSNASFIFIAPWVSRENDTGSRVNHIDKLGLIQSYSSKLKTYASDNNYGYIDINSSISATLDRYIESNYMLDAIHPNSSAGIKLYAELVMKY